MPKRARTSHIASTADLRAEFWQAPVEAFISPLAPAANPQRFTDSRKVEKWFRRNCGDVLDRECTAQEKADVLAWLDANSRRIARTSELTDRG